MKISVMFKIPEAMMAYWKKYPEPKAGSFEVARIEAAIGSPLPLPYIEFITQYGSVVFGRDTEARCLFNYIINFPDRKEIREGNIAFFEEPDKLIQGYKILTTKESKDDEDFPKFPANYLPIGNDVGQGQILLEIGEHAGRIWYWPEKEWAWGVEDNTWLGFVANDLYEFINGLRSDPDLIT
ncbi:MAG: SMI1/KNR4 family protein [Candidatus Methylumidiphilus sp.]